MVTAAVKAYGTLLKAGDGATPEVFTTIAEVKDISGPAVGQDAIEVTSHDSTGGWEEFIGGILRSGEVTFGLNYLPANATHDATSGLLDDLETQTVRNFQVVFPDSGSTTWSFAALVTRFEPSAPVAGNLGASVTLKLTGQPTLA